MNDWQSTYLGRGALPRDLSGFENTNWIPRRSHDQLRSTA
jgi:hypothetical protein